MNPLFTRVTLNSFIFAMDIFYTGAAKKFVIIGITAYHQASVCLLHIAVQ